jgi:hypothetical protein
VTRLRGGRSWLRIPLRTRDIIFSETSMWTLGLTQSCINGSRGSLEKRPEREVTRPLASNAEVKVDQSYRPTSAPPVCQHGADKDSFAVIMSY